MKFSPLTLSAPTCELRNTWLQLFAMLAHVGAVFFVLANYSLFHDDLHTCVGVGYAIDDHDGNAHFQ